MSSTPNTEMQILGYRFDGLYKPTLEDIARGHTAEGFETFSVGCFPLIHQTNPIRGKRGKVVVRVAGKIRQAERVYERAREICRELDAGCYSGPKNVDVASQRKKKKRAK